MGYRRSNFIGKDHLGPRAGDVLENPVTGQRLVFRKLHQAECVSPAGALPPHQEERFEVLSGKLNAVIDGRERTLRAGEVHITWQTRPALKTEAFFETIWGLANDGKTNEKGAPTCCRWRL